MNDVPNLIRIGIPYAPSIAPDYKTVQCPICGERFAESHDKHGEQTSQNYADHYADAHRADDDRAFYRSQLDIPNASDEQIDEIAAAYREYKMAYDVFSQRRASRRIAAAVNAATKGV